MKKYIALSLLIFCSVFGFAQKVEAATATLPSNGNIDIVYRIQNSWPFEEGRISLFYDRANTASYRNRSYDFAKNTFNNYGAFYTWYDASNDTLYLKADNSNAGQGGIATLDYWFEQAPTPGSSRYKKIVPVEAGVRYVAYDSASNKFIEFNVEGFIDTSLTVPVITSPESGHIYKGIPGNTKVGVKGSKDITTYEISFTCADCVDFFDKPVQLTVNDTFSATDGYADYYVWKLYEKASANAMIKHGHIAIKVRSVKNGSYSHWSVPVRVTFVNPYATVGSKGSVATSQTVSANPMLIYTVRQINTNQVEIYAHATSKYSIRNMQIHIDGEVKRVCQREKCQFVVDNKNSGEWVDYTIKSLDEYNRSTQITGNYQLNTSKSNRSYPIVHASAKDNSLHIDVDKQEKRTTSVRVNNTHVGYCSNNQNTCSFDVPLEHFENTVQVQATTF